MIRTGIDVLFRHRKNLLAGKKIGIVANPSSVNSSLDFMVDLFLKEKSWLVSALFGPEHGLRGELQDQELCDSFEDDRARLPVYSLYGEHLKPTAQMLKGLDAVVFDIQDVGSRYYTFIYTLSYVMEACKEQKVQVVVLDRPNPINGIDTEGPILESGFESFVGRYPIPIRHGMTVGELAIYFHQEFDIRCNLEVIELEGWKRSYYFEDTGLPWVMPSPNMPTVDTAIVYPGMCLLEGTNVSEGRGTTRPFEIFGAPWIEPDRFCAAMEDLNVSGVRLRPLYFRPTFNKYHGELCGGVQLHVTDRRVFQPVFTALCALHILLRDFSNSFRWKEPPYEFVTDRAPIDVLFGNSWIREELEKGTHPREIEAKWTEETEKFRRNRERYLLYSD